MKVAITLTFFLPLVHQTSSKQIVGGEETVPNRYPYMVGLTNSIDSEFYCGGTLIAPEWVLSAAQCINMDGNITAIIGRYNISDPTEDYEVINVTEAILHPENAGLDNDFMLLKLETPSNHSFVKLDDGFLDLDFRTDLTAMGWGTDNFEEEIKKSEVLMEVEVDYVPQLLCKLRYLFLSYTDTMLCAYRRGKDACIGDGGGPIILKGDDESTDIQVGIISWGVGCATPFAPGVYSRLSSGMDFIREYVPSV